MKRTRTRAANRTTTFSRIGLQSVCGTSLPVVGRLRLRPPLYLRPPEGTIRSIKTRVARKGTARPARGYAGAAANPELSHCNNCGKDWHNPRGRRQACPRCYAMLTLLQLRLLEGPGGQLALPLPAMRTLRKLGAHHVRRRRPPDEPRDSFAGAQKEAIGHERN